MKKTVKIFNREHELFWSAQAMSAVCEKCGKLKNLENWIKGEDPDDIAGIYTRFTEVLEILANASIKRDNYAIKQGFMQGEEKREFKAGDLSLIIGMGDLGDMIESMYGALERDTNYEVPEGAKVEQKEVDETLEEIQENRRKKEESGE